MKRGARSDDRAPLFISLPAPAGTGYRDADSFQRFYNQALFCFSRSAIISSYSRID
ncbi:hypothetical protein HNQ81_001319 [Desulfoprunum benzoelyticum]|uniref:Uncharacterized protein n=1 Tax=Desulfoprunum benzoelyticum TaxID=1506996 RepID=A0A840UY63_9BACT|nr:hypothetical protein [Desulfoprunum benzoelyticum]